MADNPYDSPFPLTDESRAVGMRSRPIGISILAVLHALGGLLFGALIAFLLTQFGRLQTESFIGWAVILLGPPLTVLAIATAVGLWRGRKWAWWLATLYYFQFVVGGTLVLAAIPIGCLFFERPVTERTVELIVKHTFRLLFFSFLTWYMMKHSVFAFFGFERLTRLRALCICSGVILLVGVVLALLMLLVVTSGARIIEVCARAAILPLPRRRITFPAADSTPAHGRAAYLTPTVSTSVPPRVVERAAIGSNVNSSSL